ncbi:MAG: TM1802 family CRISPR-associated protein, partial [Methanobacteriota archaeon]
MLTSYETLGKIVAPSGLDSLEPFVETVGRRLGEEPRLVILEFDTAYGTVGFSVQGITLENSAKYAIIADPDGTQSPVPRLTNKSLKVILGQGPHLVRDALDDQSSLRPVLDRFIRTFYGILGKHAGGTDEAHAEAEKLNESGRRSSYFFDTRFFDPTPDIVSFTRDPEYKKKMGKPTVKPHNVYHDVLKKAVTSAYQKHMGDPKARIPKNIRWSLRIDGEDVATHPDYAKVALRSLKPDGADPSVVCFACGERAATERTGHLIKFYTETNPTLYNDLKKSS